METLSIEQRQRMQEKVSHYLKGFRVRNSLTQEECANKTGFSLSQIKKLESIDGISPTVNAIDTLIAIAKVDNLSLVSFANYLLPDPSMQLKAELPKWKRILLEKVNYLNLRLRREFIHKTLRTITEGEQIDRLIEFTIKFQKMKPSEREIVENLINHFLKEPTK